MPTISSVREPNASCIDAASSPTPLDSESPPSQPARPRRDRAGRRFAAGLFAAVVAILGWSALAIDGHTAIPRFIAEGHSLAGALFIYFRFFTILTNVGLASLMTATALAISRGKALPSAALFRAALVYMIVTGLTYELLLRHLWSPRGMQFVTDLIFHDIEPALLILFWIGFAPKRGLTWRDLPWLLVYPAFYFAITLIAGARGAGYPYDFLDAAKLGYPTVVAIGVGFLAVFLVLGTIATLVARGFTDDRSAAV